MKSKHTLTSDQKLKLFGYGEWVEEPDLVFFKHAGLHCRVIRAYAYYGYNRTNLCLGHLCGYVKIPKDNPIYGKNLFKNDFGIDIHGGLTFGELTKNSYWIGFDCSHSDDISPSYIPFYKIIEDEMKEKYKTLDFSPLKRTYKNIEFVVKETKSLAMQVKSLCVAN